MAHNRVVIAFVAENSGLTEQHWLNRTAAWLAPEDEDGALRSKIIHCELFFPNAVGEARAGNAYGIFWGGPVWSTNSKRYSNKDYLFKTIPLNSAQKKRMVNYLDAQVGKGFNHIGYASFLTPCSVSGNLPGMERTFYCSQLTMSALNESGIFGASVHLDENVHPHAVFSMLAPYSTLASHPVRRMDFSKLDF
jgi:hypothetical protein|tara:strand:+ start:374 stop:952 length:579 start_codon:yes stop_codon:yes gene_type:complete